MANKRKVGSHYETIAAQYLRDQGYEILEQNYYCHLGEIDLIAKQKEDHTLVFCEVKYRKNLTSGNPLEAVNAKKQRTIYYCAMEYITTHHMDGENCRFDVIGILGDEITWVPNAFEG